MIEGLLEEIALDGQAVSPSRTAEAPEALLADVVVLFESGAHEKGVTLTVESRPGLRSVSCDRDQILRVFGNLVGNAAKFTPPGGMVSLRAEQAGAAIRFSVSDNGPGIPPEQLPSVFDRGFRGQRQQTGLGLGLAIAKSIVEAHGGTIGVESQPGKGSTFWFTLPEA